MNSVSGKTYWLIGASEGLGRALAKELDLRNATLILSARNSERLESLSSELKNASILRMDVADPDSVERATAEIGEIDGVIYNAGAYEPMPAVKWNTDSIFHMHEINFSGAVRVLGKVLPKFLHQGQGDITLIGSLAAYRGLPSAIGYGSSKAAMRSLAETLRHDLSGSGVRIRLINPGFIRTRLTDKNNFKMPMLMEPEQAAKTIANAMQSSRFRTDFPRPFSWAIHLRSWLPDWLIYRS